MPMFAAPSARQCPKKWLSACVVVLLFADFSWPATATQYEPVSQWAPTKRSAVDLYLRAQEVPAFIAQQNGKVLFVDVRTEEEVREQGTPAMVDANVPYFFSKSYVLPWGSENYPITGYGTSGFSRMIGELAARKGLTKHDPVILISNHGERSALAASLLAWHGFTRVYSVIDGYAGDIGTNGSSPKNGWRGHRLPWKIDPAPPHPPLPLEYTH